ncbi:MAG: tetratricopeptide repeat protein [Anaerolineae bacterium]
MSLKIGQLVSNRYRVIRILGQGGFGAVYLVEDTRLAGRLVALKETFNNMPEAIAQFEFEARVLAQLFHPSLPRVSDFFPEPNGHRFLIMDYIEGQDLDKLIERRVVSETQAIQWLIQVSEAVAYLHGQNTPVIHRDIKPNNIKIKSDGRAVLVDFGIAKLYNPQKRTVRAARAVTPGFSPPEQYFGGTNARSDVYALGATLYCALTRTVPPEGLELLDQPSLLIAPRRINPKVSQAVEETISRAMSLNSLARYGDAREFVAALKAAQGGQVSSVPRSGVQCPRCGYINRATAKFCQQDGTPLRPASGPQRPQPGNAGKPLDPQVHFEAGNLWARRKNYQQAAAEYAQARHGGYDNAALYYNWADALLELKRLPEAVSTLQQGIARHPDDADLAAQLGYAHARNGQTALALQELERALTLDAHRAETHWLLAQVHTELGQKPQAIAAIKQVIAAEPNLVVAHMRLGQLYLDANDLALAQSSFQRVIQIDSRNVDGHLFLGLTHLRAKRNGDAIKSAQKVIQLDPKNSNAYYVMGQAYRAAKKWDEAVNAFAKSAELDPTDALSQYFRGQSLMELSKWREAIGALEESARLDPKDPDPHTMLAICHAQLNQPAQALQAIEQALQIDPNNQAAQTLLKKL